jgi:hypothetical protein
MVIWTRWGILGLLIPMVLILIAQEAMKMTINDEPMPVKRAAIKEDSEVSPTDEEAQELRTAERKKAEQKRAADHLKAIKNAKDNGYGIGCLATAVVLWPLGRLMNKTETRLLIDQQTGQPVEMQVGGGNTLFFIPLEYWSFIWPAFGLYKVLS